MGSEERQAITSKEINIVCAGLLKLRDQCPRRGQTILAVRCPDTKTRHISLDDLAVLVDKITVLSGAEPGKHKHFADALAEEVKKQGGHF